MEPLEVRKINVTENETTVQVPALVIFSFFLSHYIN